MIITVCGSNKAEPNSRLYKSAEELGKLLADNNFKVAGAGFGGVTDAVINGVKQGGGEITLINGNEDIHEGDVSIHNEQNVQSYIERMIKFLTVAEAIVILDGGSGTLLELSTVLALQDRGAFQKKSIICIGEQWKEALEIMAFYSIEMQDSMTNLVFVDSPKKAVDILVKVLHK